MYSRHAFSFRRRIIPLGPIYAEPLLPYVFSGNEAGGHGLSTSPALHLLLPQVLKAIPSWKATNPSSRTPVLLGAGGLSNGRSLASILALGASGGLFGTRFLVSKEATYTDQQKKILLATGLPKDSEDGEGGDGDGTLRTMAFDEARNTLGWPKNVDGRGIRNQTVLDYENDEVRNEESLKKRQERYEKAVEEKDDERITTWAGTGVGLMDKIGEAENIVREIDEECRVVLEELKGLMEG